jgi:DNA-binding MarR family transcriptional regulator
MPDGSIDGPDIASLAEVDKMVHEPGRLAILTYLSMVKSADFLFIQNVTGLTKGNLSSHMRKLEDAGYIQVIKEFVDRKPHTMLRITPMGLRAYEDYKQSMARILGSPSG